MREDAVDPPSNGPQTLYGALFDCHTTVKVFVAVEQCGGTVESMEGVVQSGALLGLSVSRAEKNPLLACRHLLADRWVALVLEFHRNVVELEAELAEVFVFPYGEVVVTFGWFQDGFHLCMVLPDHQLYILLDCEGWEGER